MKPWIYAWCLFVGGGIFGVLNREALTLDDVIACVIRPEYGPMEDNKLTVNVFCEEYR